MMLDRNQMRLALLKVTAMVLVGTTWIFSSFVFGTRPEQAEANPIVDLVRLPASLPAQIPGMVPVVKVMEPIAMDTVKLPCWDQLHESENATSARWIRLLGRDCEGMAASESVTVKNLRNGFSATVFQTLPRNSLTTDYIPLE